MPNAWDRGSARLMASMGFEVGLAGCSFAAFGALADAARELNDQGTYGFLAQARTGRDAVQSAFSQ